MKLWIFLSKKETPVITGCEFWSPLTQEDITSLEYIESEKITEALISFIYLSSAFFPICKIGSASRLRLVFHVENKRKMGKKTVLSLAL